MDTRNPEELKRKAEIDRLMSFANVQRMRGELVPAEDNCRKVLEVDPQNAQARELLADLLYERGKLDDAFKVYKSLLEKYPNSASIEKKYAKTALEIGEREHEKLITRDMLENPQKYAAAKRNAGIAVFLSVVAPGFGHIYLGNYVKGLVILGAFLLSWLIVAVSPGTQLFAQAVGDYIRRPAGGLSTFMLSPLAVFFAGVAVFTYIYAIIDTAVVAGKSDKSGL